MRYRALDITDAECEGVREEVGYRYDPGLIDDYCKEEKEQSERK